MPPGFTPIVADNGSTDGSGELARSLGARVVVEPTPGFGAACFAGLTAATGEIVCFMDCDASLDPGELTRITAPLEHADLVLGARRGGGRGRPNRGFRGRGRGRAPRGGSAAGPPAAPPWGCGPRRKPRLPDRGPMRAARRGPLLGLNIGDRRFGWPLEMVLRA